ncbi:galactinol synthase 2 [Phtheirospermum japonicum]|uniref:Hexosyltransferase n=1 Tax=Phtheirospermum japonicum TaxID=374723 RepID=A0A830B6V4_9LAMI|nr:galactinol synthase 2 [Phtheirospermum japonicum]
MAPPEVANNQTTANDNELNINSYDACAYVTFLAGDGDYVKGVIGLAKGLRKVRAAFPLVVAVLPDVPPEHRRALVEQGCLVREIQPASPPPTAPGDKSPFARPYFVVNYCKLRLWEFVEYDKMVYMDADIQVFDNIDHLFNLPSGFFYGVSDCVCELYGPPCPQKLPWPAVLGPQPSFYLNGGMFMFEPNLNTYNELLSTLEITPPTPFAEQDFLNMFFRDVLQPIPPVYNCLVAMMWRHPKWVNLDEVKVVHYCVAGSKPWRYTGIEENMDRADIKMLVSKWWAIYNDEDLDFETDMASGSGGGGDGGSGSGGGGSGPPESQNSATALTDNVEAVVQYISASSAA